MATVRARIRDGYIEKLIAAVPTVQGRVYSVRKPRLSKSLTPCLSVFWSDGTSSPVTAFAPRTFEERMELVITGYTDAPDEETEAILDNLLGEVQRALDGERLGGLVKSATRTRTRQPDPTNGEGGAPGVVALGYEIVFYTVEGDPDKHR